MVHGAVRLGVFGALAAALSPGADFFPVSVWYGGGKARAPMLESGARSKKELWRKDVRAIRDLGFNTIRSWIDWSSGEPAPGQYHLDTFDVLLELAGEEGLKLVLQVYMDSAPAWVGRRYPDAKFVAINGTAIESEGAPGYCTDHPGVRKAALAFYEALARRAARSSAFLGWDLWSEPHVINWANATWMPAAEYCFCPHTVGRFREWLRARYGTIDALNSAWYRQYANWNEVAPNRLSTILSYTDYVDWRRFIQQKLGEDLRDRYTAVKTVLPMAVATSHAAAPSLFTSPLAGDGSPDDWIMRRQVDFYGTSFYPKHSAPVGRDPAWRGALLDFAASAGYSGGRRGFWIGELQAGFGTIALNVSDTVTAADLRMWAWSAVARGAKAIHFYAWYPMSTGYESGGYGLIGLDGTITERARAAGEVARTIARHAALLSAAEPAPAEAAILYNPSSYLVGGRQRAAVFGGAQGEVVSIERDSLLGAYRALFRQNVAARFLHVDGLEASDLARYPSVLLPYPVMLPARVGKVLEEYVRAGGRLVIEARAGWMDENARASEVVPGLGLDRVLGCREASVRTAAGGRTEIVWEDGRRLPARWFEEELEPLGDAQVVGRFPDGRVAAVRNRYGKGTAVTLGSYVMAALHSQPEAAVELPLAPRTPRYAVSPAGLEVREMMAGGERLLFVFHHGTGAAEAVIRLSEPAATVRDLETGADAAAGDGVLRKKLPPQGVWIVRIGQ